MTEVMNRLQHAGGKHKKTQRGKEREKDLWLQRLINKEMTHVQPMSHRLSDKCGWVSDQRQSITSDIRAAGQTANSLQSAYQCAALPASPEDTHTHTHAR